jgi:hypothetical protein
MLFGLSASAAADPPAVDFDPCANTLDRAGHWPGELGDGSRHFSDGFDSYLSRQAACAGAAPTGPGQSPTTPASDWPGDIPGVDEHRYVVFSDGYGSYILRRDETRSGTNAG